jgi:hypothetical protein
MGRWKSDKEGNHFKGKKKIRSSEPSTEVNIEIDNNSDDFAESIRKDWIDDKVKCVDCGINFTQHSLGKQHPDFIRCTSCEEENEKSYIIKKRNALVNALDDADRRFNIAISRMSEITNRLHELEIQRNLALRKEFLAKEIETNPEISKSLIEEFNSINADNRDIMVYEEVAKGYRSMSRRKNELEEERNQYVKEIEELDDKIDPLNNHQS